VIAKLLPNPSVSSSLLIAEKSIRLILTRFGISPALSYVAHRLVNHKSNYRSNPLTEFWRTASYTEPHSVVLNVL